MSYDDDFEVGDGFHGVQEAPLPDSQPAPKRRVVQPTQRESSMPDPNKVVQRPKNVPHANYNNNGGKAKMGRTQEINQGYSQPGQTIAQPQSVQQQPQATQQSQPQQQPQQRKPMQRKAQVQQQMQQQMQTPPPNQQVPQQSAQGTSPQPQKPVKKKSKLPLIIGGVVLVAVLGVVGVKVINGNKLVAQTESYESSGKFALDNLQSALNNYDASKVDDCVGTGDGDSYLGQEWAYVNGVKLREEFIKKVTNLVKFEYPQVQQMSTTGVGMTEKDGSKIMIESMMNNGEAVTVTIPDYDALSQTMDEDIKQIQSMFKSSKYSESDYDWYNEMANLMLQYVCDKDSIHTKTVELELPLAISTSGRPYVKDDALLDDALFGSDEFHNMCAKFSQLCLGYTGYKDEHYTEKEEQPNPEYDEWYALFNKYYTEDNGKFNKNTSKWEPWYLRDENDNYILDENGEKKVNYYSVKDENGKDWIEPSKTIMVDVDKVRQVPDEWVEETGILYNWIGCNFIQNKYTGKGDTVVRVGDGSIEKPAGIGTTIITKVLCTDGKYHDVRVALLGYWTEQNAIDYAEKFSTKNRGFTTSSVVQLITYEVSVENLENQDITFVSSEMTLTDKNSNISSRTGTMYGFSETVTVKAGETTIINDWATSTELAQKYVCWGKDFGRNYSMVYFDALAGTGNIPKYSAYEQFTGKSSIDDSINIDTSNQTSSSSNGVDESDTLVTDSAEPNESDAQVN